MNFNYSPRGSDDESMWTSITQRQQEFAKMEVMNDTLYVFLFFGLVDISK